MSLCISSGRFSSSCSSFMPRVAAQLNLSACLTCLIFLRCDDVQRGDGPLWQRQTGHSVRPRGVCRVSQFAVCCPPLYAMCAHALFARSHSILCLFLSAHPFIISCLISHILARWHEPWLTTRSPGLASPHAPFRLHAHDCIPTRPAHTHTTCSSGTYPPTCRLPSKTYCPSGARSSKPWSCAAATKPSGALRRSSRRRRAGSAAVS